MYIWWSKYVTAIFSWKLISSIVFEIDLLETNVCHRVMENNLHKFDFKIFY